MKPLLPQPKPNRQSREADRKAARANRAAKVGAARAEVLRRAGYRCENPACPHRGERRQRGVEVDHYLGGIGRRRRHERPEDLWALCAGPDGCHAAKTANDPSIAVWNVWWIVHCRRHGYPVTLRLERFGMPGAVNSGTASTTKPNGNGE